MTFAWWTPSPLLMLLSAPFVLSALAFVAICWFCDGRPADLEPEDLHEPLVDAAPFDWEWHEEDFFWERAA